MDSKGFQVYAIREGDIDLMRYLVGKDSQLLEDREIVNAACGALHHPQILHYLVTKAKFDVNHAYQKYAHLQTPETNLLVEAIEVRVLAAVSTLIWLGADPELPGLLPFAGTEAVMNATKH
jgi:hypothetical protein